MKRKVLVMELAGLGDDVHLLPALWALRQAEPDAELHVMASAHVADLFKLTAWVDRVWSYPRVPRRPGFFGNLQWMQRLRAEQFDVVINTTGSDRSALLTGGSGARERIGRRPPSGGRFWWKWMFTRVLEHPFWQEPMYRQKLAVFAQAGLANAAQAHFEIQIAAQARRALGIEQADEQRYLHVSPCAGHPRKEIPVEQLARVIATLRRERPDLKLALSCADLPRERERLEGLLAALPEPPWKVFAGTLGIPDLAAVIQGAKLHLCGDSGSLHLAFMTSTPAVAWFREHVNMKEWIPQGPRYRVLIGPDGADQACLRGIEPGALEAAALDLLGADR